MRLQELLNKAERERNEARAKNEAERAAKRRADAADLAQRDSAFRTWLGEMADDFEIAEPWWDANGHAVWRIRPRAWRIDWTMGVGEREPGYSFSFTGLGSVYAATADYSPALSQFLLDAHRAHDEEVAKRVGSYQEYLATPRDVGCSDDEGRLRQAHVELVHLAPELAAEWDALLNTSLEALGAWQDDQAEKAFVRSAAVERFREALEAWADECTAVRAHNAEVIAGLREDLEDVKQDVMEVEYAVVAADDDYGPYLETRRVWAVGIVAGSDDRTFLVVEDGRVREWTFRHLVGFSEPVTVRPSERPGLFARARIDDDKFFYLPEYEDWIAAARRALREFPAEPLWSDYGAGLEWGSDVARVVVPARARARAGAESDPF